MIHINLLPVRDILRRKKATKQLGLMLAAFLLVIVALVAFTFFQKNTITEKRHSVTKLEQEKKRYKKTLNKIKQLQEQTKTLENRIGVIKKLKNTSSLTVHVLDEVARLTPSKRIWLTSFSQKAKSLSLSGMALDNRTIAKYMDDLKTSSYISNVNLKSSSLKGYAGRDLKAYS